MPAASLVPLWESVCRLTAEASQSSDRELLERFSHLGDQSAFEAVVRRHGPLVLGVCRRVLGNAVDAEDAFQAVFLVLAQKAAKTDWQESVAGWLHRTALHIARNARTAADRRARREKQAPVRQAANPLEELTAQELLNILDEELLRLPDRHRAALVLCCLEGASRDEAAQQLGCPPATLKSWMERGRHRLHQALQRRGLELSAVLGAAALTAGGAVAAEAVRTTMRAARALAAGERLAGLVSTNVTHLMEGGLPVMALNKVRATLALVLLCGVCSAAVLATATTGREVKQTNSAADKKSQAAAPGQEKDKLDKGKEIFRGRVLSPEGKPVHDAKVLFVRWKWADEEHTRSKRSLAARSQTDAGGMFQLDLPPPGLDDWGKPLSASGVLLAVAPGYGPAAVRIIKPEDRDTMLKLVRDDVPLQGRIVDLDGKPVADVRIDVHSLWAVQDGKDLSEWEKELRAKKAFQDRKVPDLNLHVAETGLAQTVQSDAQGRFRLAGFGRERLVGLRLSGPTIETQIVYARTRPGGTFVVLRQRGEPHWGWVTIHGAVFTHAAAPTRAVVGTVTDKATGKPLEGVAVRAHSTALALTDTTIAARTDKQGRYRLVGLPHGGGQEISVTPDPRQGYLPSGGKTSQSDNLAPARLDFPLSRGVVIRGRVTDKATGKPVRARVRYFAFTDNPFLKEYRGFIHSAGEAPLGPIDGTFTVVGLPGRGIVTAIVYKRDARHYLVGVGADGIKDMGKQGDFSTWPYYVNPATTNTLVGLDLARDAREVVCNLALDPGKTLKGTIVDPDGKPISGVRLHASWGNTWVPREPLPTPHFTLPSVDLDRPQAYFFQHKEKKLGVVVLFKPDKTDGVTVKLQRCGVITGRMLDLDGVPLANRGLVGFVEGGQFNIKDGWGGFFWSASDKDGHFRIEVIPGVQVSASVLVTATGSGDHVFEKLTLKPGQVHDVGDIKVNPRRE